MTSRCLPAALEQTLREFLTEGEYDEIVGPWAEDLAKAPEWLQREIEAWERTFGEKSDEKERRP